eukprot:GHVU01177799.1.p1 GENE.GHVU01177799.1~~GHVU01177799.1.p1  ORF type:complete len:375 (+),score=66.67 GHVU01177799.1:166-1290(+)
MTSVSPAAQTKEGKLQVESSSPEPQQEARVAMGSESREAGVAPPSILLLQEQQRQPPDTSLGVFAKPSVGADIFYDETFDAVGWLENQIVEIQTGAQGGDDVEALERGLQAMETSLEVLVGEMSNTCNTLGRAGATGLEATDGMLGRLEKEAGECHRRADDLLIGLSAYDGGDESHGSLAVLDEIDSVKERLQTCNQILSDIQQWDIRVREIELLLASADTCFTNASQSSSSAGPSMDAGGSDSAVTPVALLQAVSHLQALRNAAAALEMFPEFKQRTQVAHKFEDRLLSLASRKLTGALTLLEPVEVAANCSLIIVKLDRAPEVAELVAATVRSLCEAQWTDIWNAHMQPQQLLLQHPGSGPTPPADAEGGHL